MSFLESPYTHIPSPYSTTGVIDACGFGQVLGIQTQVDRLAWQAFCLLSMMPVPETNSEQCPSQTLSSGK